MKRATLAAGAGAVVLVALAVAAGQRAPRREGQTGDRTSPAPQPSAAAEAPAPAPATGSSQGFIHGRIATVDGATCEGRLRWGGDQEAFWSDLFNGVKLENPWLAQVPPEQMPETRVPIQIFGLTVGSTRREIDGRRPFVAPFGALARIEVAGDEVKVTLKGGSVVALGRLDAGDIDDGVRVWDDRRGVVDLDSLRIRTIDFRPTPPLAGLPGRLHGTVRTRQGEFTGFVGWRGMFLASDELDGRSEARASSLRFDTIRSIANHGPDSSLVTLLDGRELVLSGTAEIGDSNRGVQVDDPRYGRVLVTWDAFERVDFAPPAHGRVGDSGPVYDDFAPGRPLAGSVTGRDGRRVAGRLVFDLDESETTETLDASIGGLELAIPFGQIASIALPGPAERGAPRARVTLGGGEELELELAGDLGEQNGGLLVFVNGGERRDYLPWSEVERIDFDRPPATDPAAGAR